MARTAARADKDEIVTVAEAMSRFRDEWVLLEVTRDHRDAMRVRGRLLAHSPTRRDLDEPYERFRSANPRAETFEFFTGDLVRTDMIVVL
jgi:hypothetical protein